MMIGRKSNRLWYLFKIKLESNWLIVIGLLEKKIPLLHDFYLRNMKNANPFLCPIHQIEMEEGINKGRRQVLHRICPECRFEMYARITEMKIKRMLIHRTYKISKNSSLAGLFEGLK